MQFISEYFGVPKQLEVVILAIIGIYITIFDSSLLNIHMHLHEAWAIHMNPFYFSEYTQTRVKYILSIIILVKALSVHILLAFYIVMMWPLVCEDKPGLMIPWLVVAGIKILFCNVFVFLLGLFICSTQGIFRLICIDFICSQIVYSIPKIYTWLVFYSFYNELLQQQDAHVATKVNPESVIVRRKRMRSIIEKMNDPGRNLISVSTINNLVHNLIPTTEYKISRSLDTLTTLMAAEEEKRRVIHMYKEYCSHESNISLKDRIQSLKEVNKKNIDAKTIKNRIGSDNTLETILHTKRKHENNKHIKYPKVLSSTTEEDARKVLNYFETNSEREIKVESPEASCSFLSCDNTVDFGCQVSGKLIYLGTQGNQRFVDSMKRYVNTNKKNNETTESKYDFIDMKLLDGNVKQ